MTDRIGQHLGNYQLTQLLGQGHWAAVYLGEHLHLHTQAAIKVLHGPWSDREVDGFVGEARMLARLRHPHIVRVLDFGVQEGTPFLVMEYAPGGTLRQLHPEGIRLPLSTVVAYVEQVASALQYAHEQRLIHRDLKPENLLLGPDQEVWLSDFGLTIVAHSARSQPFQQTAGTLAYMAPEQLQGHPTPASDQYALGVLVYEWLTGSRPFSGTLTELAVKQALAPPPALSEKVLTLPALVDQVVLQALAKDAQLRFASVQAFALALEAASREDASRQTLPVLASGDPAEAGRWAASMDHLPRGTVTLLFSDMEGSTSLLQQLGERYPQVLGECRRLLRAAFHQWHGHKVDTQGDAFFVAFARATDALSAAVDAQRAHASHPWPEGAAMRVRIGLHTGEPSLTSEGYVGLVVHRAARIMSAGHGGQVLLSQTTHDLVEQDLPDTVSLRDLGEQHLKDLRGPQRLFQLVIADLPADFPPLKTIDISPNNLPIQPTPFIGREQELTVVGDLLRREEVRLLTLTGPGGTGKTRLGLQVAAELSDRFTDGVFFVNLAPLTDPELVVSTISQALGVREQASQPLLDSLKEHLRDRYLLLLLDNFEQVVSAAPVVAQLLAAAPHLHVLVTSRTSLHLSGEREFVVPPLTLPDLRDLPPLDHLTEYGAVRLFIERAQAVQSDFALTEGNAATIAAICHQLDGLPLAIELAAGRSKLFSPQALLPRLRNRLKLLVGGARDRPSRQQTLRGTIAWSYDLLGEAEKALFGLLSVFVGGCTLEAAEAVCHSDQDLEGDVLDAVAGLVDKSLLRQEAQADGEPRLLMLETIREYAVERLAESGETEAIRRRHATFFLALAEEAAMKQMSTEQSTWRRRLEVEHDNLRAALRWTLERQEAQMGLRLAGALFWFWEYSNHTREGRSWCEQVLAQPGAKARTADRLKALVGMGLLAFFQGDFPEAHRLLEESVTVGREVGTAGRRDLARALMALGHVALLQGNPSDTRELVGEGLQVFQEIGDTWGVALAMHHLGRATLELGDPVAARPLLEESAALLRVVGDWHYLAMPLNALGLVALRQGDYAGARTHLEEALSVARETGFEPFIADALAHLGTVALRMGDYPQSAAHYQQSLALNREQGNRDGIAEDLAGLAAVTSLLGQPERAARLFGAVEALRGASSIRLSPLRRAEYDRALEGIRAHLDEATFAAAWQEGRMMPLEQVIALAGETKDAPPTEPKPSEANQEEASSDLPPTSPDGLTAREVEVLRLLARGLSNAQIADELVVSLLTVKAHLRSIYSKVGVTSRSAATRYALEHHLS